MVKKSRVAAALVCLVLGLALLGTAASAADTTVTVADSADTFTSSGTPTTNYGNGQTLGVYATPVQTAVLRFVIPAAPAGQTLTGARLRIRTDTIASAGSVSAVNVRTASDTWTETGTTYNTRPTLGTTVLGTLPGGTAPSTAYSIALTPAALGTGSTTLAVQGTGSDSFWFWSRTAPVAANRPVLELTYSPSTPPPPADTTPPSTPAGLAATVTGSSVSLAWSPSTDDRAVTGYRIHRSDTAGFTPGASTLVGTVTSPGFSDPSRPAGTWYYRVVAVDAAGNASGPSDVATAVVPPGDPSPPTNISVTDTADTFTSSGTPTTNYGNGQTLGVYGSPVQSAVLRFVIPAAPAGQTLTGAKLRLRTDSIASAGSANLVNVRTASDDWTETGTTYTTRPALGSTVIGTLPGGSAPATAYTVTLDPTALSSGSTTLAFQGTGTDSFWFWSRTAPVAANRPVLDLTYTTTTPPPPPDTEAPTAATDLAATVNGSAVTLTWTAATDDRAVTSYVVHRSADADFTPTADTAIGTVTGTTTTDTARPQGTWHYLVVARDAAGNTGPASNGATAEVTQVLEPTVRVVAAGDLVCPPGTEVTPTTCKHQEVRNLADTLNPERFIAVGDLAQGLAPYSEFVAPGRFADTFGDLGSKLLPVIGNHEAYTPQASGYWDYFYGAGVNTGPYGDRPVGWYTQKIGNNWRFIGLNSECDAGGLAGGCGVGSPEYTWLKALLESDTTPCTVVAYHRPRWTTGAGHPPYVEMAPLWDLMASHGVDIVLSGHNHVAETFKPIGVSGTAATPVLSPTGIRQFTVGIGGASQYTFNATDNGNFSALESRAKGAFGVLRLDLKSDGYDWGFVPIPGNSFVNSGTTGSFTGSTACH